MREESDVIIVGGGLVGSVLALGLAQEANLTVTLLEAKPELPEWSVDQNEDRVIALALSSQRILSRLNLWSSIAQKRISPFQRMEVWEEKTGATLHFASENVGEAVLGYIVENNVIQQTVLQAVLNHPTISYHAPVALNAIKLTAEKIAIETDQGVFSAKLAVGADGAHSWLAAKTGLSNPLQSYA